MHVEIRMLEERDIVPIAEAFAAIGWDKPEAQYRRYHAEQQAGRRVTLVAFADDVFAGYLNVIWEAGYPPFRATNIPVIEDFNVLPVFRRQGIGTNLMDAAETLAFQRSPIVGIGVGMTADYGAAQRMYVRRGYIPDGLGLTSHERRLRWGETVTVDDGLVLWFTKARPAQV